MEAPAVFVILLLYANSNAKPPTTTIFVVLRQLYYACRTFIYPLLMREGRKGFPIVLVALALLFNCANGYVNGWFLFQSGRSLGVSWFANPRFIAGTIMFLPGLCIHARSDHI